MLSSHGFLRKTSSLSSLMVKQPSASYPCFIWFHLHHVPMTKPDTSMLLHASHATKHGHHSILIRAVDTDVVVLTISMAQGLKPGDELWLAFGTGKGFRYLAAHELAVSLGPEKALALPMFHALTGCDTVSSFAGHGKKTAWVVWALLPELTTRLLQLSSAPDQIPEEAMDTIELIVILLYDRTSTCQDVDKVRKKLFTWKHNVKLIPPTKAALEEHVKRATYQGGHVWGQALLPAPALPSPTDWGWTRNSQGTYEPHWTRLPDASQTCYELLSCKCLAVSGAASARKWHLGALLCVSVKATVHRMTCVIRKRQLSDLMGDS